MLKRMDYFWDFFPPSHITEKNLQYNICITNKYSIMIYPISIKVF